MFRIATASLFVLAASPAFAQTIDFEGTRENVNPLSPPGTGRCSPPNFNTVTIAPGAISSTGTSNIGTFTSTQSHCIVTAPPTTIVDGEFTYTFRAGDTITGTYSGNVALGGAPGTFASTENLIVTGGTGRFVGANGTIISAGSLMLANGRGVFNGTLDGTIQATAATATGNFATATGEASAALGDLSTAYGGLSIANATGATAVGALAEATGARASALGSSAVASGTNASALGSETVASGLSASALGYQAQATGIASSAIGHNTRATGLGSTAVGVSAQATQLGATALGRLANAGFAGSTAIGTNSATTAANQVALGGTGSAVRIGDIAASTAAQSGSVDVTTVDANGVLGRNTTLLGSVAALQSASSSQSAMLSSLGSSVATLFDLQQRDSDDFKRGIAASVAMGHASFPSAPGKTSYVLNGSVFRGQPAVGGSLMHRFDTDTPIALGVGFSIAGKKNNAFRVGVAGEF